MNNAKTMKHSYKQAIESVLEYGEVTPATKALFRQQIEFPMFNLNENEAALPKFRSNELKSSPKYAIAELIWYMSKRLDTDLIAKFAPIWKLMEDENGLINSNYGYQAFENQDVTSKLKELATKKEASFFIISEENQSSRTDLVCNNLIKFVIDDNNIMQVYVIARSIDLTFGYPYDMFIAQVFANFVKEKLLSDFDLRVEFDNLLFEIQNMHIYHKDIAKLDVEAIGSEMDDKLYFVFNSKKYVDKIGKKSITTAEELGVFRQELLDELLFEEKRLEMLHSPVENNLIGNLHKVKSVEEIYSIICDKKDNKKASERISQVINFLEKDEYDRKNAVVNGAKLFYIFKAHDGWLVNEYK